MFPSYRNQSVDLQRKSANWFLHNGKIGRQRVKTKFDFPTLRIFRVTRSSEFNV